MVDIHIADQRRGLLIVKDFGNMNLGSMNLGIRNKFTLGSSKLLELKCKSLVKSGLMLIGSEGR